MKIQITHNLLYPQAGMRKVALRTLALAAMLFTFLLPARLFSQTEPSALLELQSTDKGFLLPRMSQSQRDAIASPATGLMIYNTTTLCLEVNHGSTAAPLWWPFSCRGSISTLSCAGSVTSGTIRLGFPASGLVSVPYTGGNGGPHAGQTVTSTGVTGLTATLSAGTFANGAGSLIYAISGTPSGVGTASFALDIGGQNCAIAVGICGAYVAPNQWKDFMCHNLGAANTAADPFTPSWEINGGYWQWGRLGPGSSQWLNTNTPNFGHGPTGPGAGQANEAIINGWDQSNASNGAWSDTSKTANDPCPMGFRVPTKAQWDGVLANNTHSITGAWIPGSTNYSSGSFFGPGLMLPAAGNRFFVEGFLFDRDYFGYYWGSAEEGTDLAWYLSFLGEYVFVTNDDRRYGFSLRCVAE